MKKLFVGEQKLFWLGIGMFFYLIKHLRSDTANAVRNVSKAMDGTNKAAFLEMHLVIKYVSDMNNLGLKIKPNINKNELWDIICLGDSYYAGDWNARRSVSGFILYVLEGQASWRSKAQRSVTMSSSEAHLYIVMKLS